VAVEGLTNAQTIAAGYAHTCALMPDATMQCWGFNLYGQLGDGTQTDTYAPVAVAGLSGVAALAPGDVQTCALMQDTTVRCWGNNLLGELGDGTRETELTPVDVCADATCGSPLDGIMQVSTGDHHACAVDEAGAVYCWGSNLSHQLGTTDAFDCLIGAPCAATPRLVHGLSRPARAVSASTASTCALLQDSSVECWGREFGTSATSVTPRAVDGWSDIETLVAAQDHVCAVDGAGDLMCLGRNDNGQLGDATTVDRTNGPPARVWLLSRRGDADCSATIDSIDASLMLQQTARLLEGLPCPNATVAPGQTISALDALAVLQYSAGLLT
jgi:alpha-tubulin suppressor-like RCC1 family protein